MEKRNCLIIFAIIFCLSFSVIQTEKAFGQGQKLTPEDVIAGHLKSIGSPEVLMKIKSRGFAGDSSIKFIQGGTGQNPNGQFIFVSEGRKLAIRMKYADIEYPQEYLAFDGEEVSVGYISPGQRSPLADFIFRYNKLMKEGLISGVWSSAWPLMDIEGRKPKFRYNEAKVEGRRLHELEYRAEKSLGDRVVAKLYFDFDTFRHVRSEFSVRVPYDLSALPEARVTSKPDALGGSSVTGAAVFDMPDSIYKLIETFDDFKEADGLVLPHRYVIQYSVEGQGLSFIGEWTQKLVQRIYNGKVDQAFFKAHK